MTTITADDIRVELDAMNESTEPSRFDIAALNYSNIKPVWAVVGRAVNLRYAISGALVGIYESETFAQKVADAMTENARLDYEQEGDYYCDGLYEYRVVELSLNDHPDPVINWHYYE